MLARSLARFPRLPTIPDGTTRRSPTVVCRTIAIAEYDHCRFTEDKADIKLAAVIETPSVRHAGEMTFR